MNQILRNIYLNNHHTYTLKENLRFELAHGPENNYYQLIENGKKRANRLFAEVFKETETVQLIFIIFEHSRKNKLDKLLYKTNFSIVDSFVTHSWSEYNDGETTVLIIETDKQNLRIAKIIDAICYKDFYSHGKLRINSPLIFYNKQDNLILNVYDDRGCDIWSDNLTRQKEIYTKYHTWLLDYDRKNIVSFYEP